MTDTQINRPPTLARVAAESRQSRRRVPSTFRQQDVTKAIRAVTAAGVGIAKVEIDKAGKITIIALGVEASRDGLRRTNEWDTVLRHDKD